MPPSSRYIARYWSAAVGDVAVLAGFLAMLWLRASRDRPLGLRRPGPR